MGAIFGDCRQAASHVYTSGGNARVPAPETEVLVVAHTVGSSQGKSSGSSEQGTSSRTWRSEVEDREGLLLLQDCAHLHSHLQSPSLLSKEQKVKTQPNRLPPPKWLLLVSWLVVKYCPD